MTDSAADADLDAVEPHRGEAHSGDIGARLNWLRAAVLGANDGIVSTAGLVIGVAAATTSRSAILVAGLAGLAAGAMSMATGEYVSVSTQRDTERALIAKETAELRDLPDEELAELTDIYRAKGLTPELAERVAVELTEHDALGAHLEAELGIDPEALTNPWQAAWASMVAFSVGAALPLLTIALIAPSLRIPLTVASVVVALGLTGWVSARLGEAQVGRAVLRNIGGGALAMVITYLVGSLVGTAL